MIRYRSDLISESMSTIDTGLFNQWNSHLATIAATTDETTLPAMLMDALGDLIESDNRTILIFGGQRMPVDLCETSADHWPEQDLQTYIRGAYLLDPYYRAGIEKVASGLYHMTELAPPAYQESEYFKTYYRNSPIEDEIGFIVHLSEECFANLAFSRTAGSQPFTVDEIARIRATLPLVESLMQRYWRAASEDGAGGSNLHAQLEDALTIFATSVLTPREAEVMRMYLYGHDTKSISERLNISAHTVSAHRKHAYARLDITSQAELFSLFINSMYCFDGDPQKDPLETYLNPPSN